MESSQESISSRRDKLNAQILGKIIDDQRLNLINRECLLDALQALFDECSIETLQKYDKQIAQFVEKYKNTLSEVKRLRVNITDFEIKDVIGRGHFGEVHVVREKQTGDIYAMKTIRKCDSLEKTSFDVERDIMACAQSPWITQLQYAFQDSIYLFFVMEYHPGGDLLGLLYRQGGTLPESAATFYLAEILLALEDLHGMGFVHRDIKPDNILLDRCGHLKLVDFGSAARLNSQGLVEAGIPVGTPDYIAPEVLQSTNKKSSYGVSCDYWSLGILAYELTVGKPPFTGQNTTTTYSRIMNHTNNLKFPSDVLLTQGYINFVRGLVTDEKSRLNGKQIRQHPLFKNYHFDTLRDQVPPYVPKITSVDDTSNFGDIVGKKSGPSVDNFKKKTQFSGRNLPFIGFTYTHGSESNCYGRGFNRSSRAKDEIIKSMKEELECVKRNLMKSEDFEEVKLVLEKKILEKTHKLESIECVREKLERELAASMAETTALKRTLEIERKDRTELERKALDLIKSAKIKWETSERTKTDSLKLEIEHQKEKITQLETTNIMLNEQLKRAFKLEHRHKESLEAVEQMNRRSLVGLESKLEKVAAENRNKIDHLITALDKTVCEKKELEEENRRLKKEREELNKNLAKSHEDYVTLNDAAFEAEKLVKELNNKVTSFENEMEKKEKLDRIIEDKDREIKQQKQKIKDLEMANLLLKNELKYVEEYKNQILLLKETKTQHEKKINELESKFQEEEQKCHELKKQLSDSVDVDESQQIKEMKVKMWKMEKDLSNAKIDKRIIDRELKDAIKEIKELNEEIKTLKLKNEENKKIHERAMLELNNIHENLSMELVKMRENYKNLEEKFVTEKCRNDEEKSTILQLKEIIKEKDSTIAGINKKSTLLKEEIASFRRTQDENKQLLEELDFSRKENQKLLDQIKDNHRQLENNKTNLEALREACVIIENQVIEYEKINSSIQSEKAKMAENTEKLIKDLCKAKEEIQDAKRQWNEEKSLRLLTETKVKRLNEDIECLQNECQSYKQQSLKYKECSNNLSDELTLCEEKVSDLEVTVKSYERQIEEFVSESNLLKEEVSQYLTQIGGMKESNFKLKQQIEDLKNVKHLLKERLEELENEFRVKVNYYEEKQVKDESIIRQQTKLIDYLQVKIDEHSQKKKTLTDKLFGHSKKENQPPIMLPINYKDLENQLQKQKQINKELQEEIFKLKTQTTPKTNKLLRHKSEIASPTTKLVMEQLSKSCKQGMSHNIPHRFVTKPSKKITECDHCSDQITLGKDVSVCSDCNICVHLTCVNSVKSTCGLPKGYVKHFKESLSKLEGDMEGWIKVLSKNNTWEKCYACLGNNCFNIYSSATKDTLVESLDLKSPDNNAKIVLEPLPSEIGVNMASSDLPFVIKIDCCAPAPQESVIFMALSIRDRDKWYKSLQKYIDEDSSDLETVVTVPDQVTPNCIIDVSQNIKILGTDQGLYSYHNESLLPLDGPTEVHQISIIPDSKIVVMIVDLSQVLISCDLNHLINLTQCAPCTQPILIYKNLPIKNLEGFHFLQSSPFGKHQMLCAATAKQLVIVKYDLETGDFVPLRIMDTAEPLSCALFTEHSLIVGADKFFEIDLATFQAEEFLDSSDSKLKYAVKCHKLQSFPLTIVQVTDNPKEYLLCFNEFCVFVDEYGRCSRNDELKTTYLPTGFHFVRPFLYILQFSGVEILRFVGDSNQSVTVSLQKMKYLGKNKSGIYVLHKNKVKFLEGRKFVDCDDASSVVTEEESDRFSFTSSMVQSLDGNLSDAENSSVEDNVRRVRFSQTNL